MNHLLKTTLSGVIIFLFLSANHLYAQETEMSNNKKIELINIAAQQRMLSQRIAKDYLYIHKNIAMNKTQKELKVSLDSFFKAHDFLVKSINDEEIHNLLDFVELSSNDFNQTIHEPFSLDNAQLVLDLSESMLEGGQYIVDSLKSSVKIEESKIIEVAGKQRMLSQRIAKYYIAYQSGIKDENTVKSMKRTVIEFSQNLEILINNKNNPPLVNKKINEVNKLWKIVHKFYNNIEKGGLPLIVFNTTDKITKKMNDITQIYLSMQK